MALIKRNLRSLFAILVCLITFGFGAGLFYIWTDLFEENEKEHHARASQILTADAAFFTNIDLLLGVTGKELLNKPLPKGQTRLTASSLDQMLDINPSFYSFMLFKLNEQPAYTTSNLTNLGLSQLLDQDELSLGFDAAFNSLYVVIGRTFYANHIDRWVVPAHKSIRDDSGEVIAVMVALIEIGDSTVYFNPKKLPSNFDSVILLRGSDMYPQFVAAGDLWPEISYKEYLTKEQWQHFTSGVKPEGKSIHEIALLGEVVAFDSLLNDIPVSGAMVYESRYDLWVISQSMKTKIHKKFYSVVGISFIAYLALCYILFILFRVIETAEKKKRDALAYQAFHDSLTGLKNRNYLIDNIQQWINSEVRPFAMLFIDMDRFKNVNDNFGHIFGDIALKEVASRLLKILPKDNLIVRQSGDEFLILSQEQDVEKLKSLGHEICYRLSELYELRGVSFELGASVGIARYPEDGRDFDAMIRAADVAMYEAKKHRNAVRFFAEAMLDDRQRKIAIESQLRVALKNDEMFMQYQPQINRDGSLYGVEGLVRWENGHLGFVPPDQFIPVAEASGLMPHLGEFITGKSMTEMYQFQQETNVDFYVSINISLKQFMHQDFLETLKSKIMHSKFDKIKVVLEITENLFIDDIEYIRPLLLQIKSMGMQISMDDFGTGYSSLNILSSLPIDELKIDKSFVDDILESDSAKNMIKNIIAIGRNYNMEIIAEGVETKEQFDLLKDYGCDRFQGYYFSRPVRPRDLKVFIEKNLTEYSF